MIELIEHMNKKMINLNGEWIKNNSNYDGDLCGKIEMIEETCRYWDARWKNYRIEFKKGKSIWLDLVRYSEILLKINDDASEETITMFFVPNDSKEFIKEVIIVKTVSIVEKLKLNVTKAKIIMELKEELPRSLNSQASLTLKDVREISEKIIKR